MTHRALGNNVAEELLIDHRSIPLLFEIETKQHSDLRLIRRILWIHLGLRHTLLKRNIYLNPHSNIIIET